MGDDGGATAVPATHNAANAGHHGGQEALAIDTLKAPRTSAHSVRTDDIKSPTVPHTPNPFLKRQTSLDLDDYFVREAVKRIQNNQATVLTVCRLGLEISPNTRNGRFLCKCTAAFSPR